MQPEPPANSFHFQHLLSIQNSTATDAPPTAFPTRCQLYLQRYPTLGTEFQMEITSNQALRNSLLVYAVLWAFRSPKTSRGSWRREGGPQKQSQKPKSRFSASDAVESFLSLSIPACHHCSVIIPPQHAPLFGPSSLNFLFRGRLTGQSMTTTFCDLFGGWWSARVVAHHRRRPWIVLDVGCLVLWHLDGRRCVRDLREIDRLTMMQVCRVP